jgi:hypothetical protein
MADKAPQKAPTASPGPPRVILTEVVEEQRSAHLRKLTSYYRCTQHAHKPFLFDGAFVKFQPQSVVYSHEEIPMRQRQPSQRLDLAKLIVDRLTSFVFGHEHFPSIKVEGDPLAQDFARELSKQAALPVRMIEARNLGGAAGSVAFSWGFVNGRPVVEVHMSAFLQVLDWADYERRDPARVIKAYRYTKREFTADGRAVENPYWYARYWDDTVDMTWQQIPEKLAKTTAWRDLPPSSVARHDAGFCPVYWVQNLPDSSDVDGMSDYEGQEECLDNADILLSATGQGTVLNVDPTLVVKDDPSNNDGIIRKGSRYALFSPGGAEYLELSGQAVKAGLDVVMRIRQFELDKASVVLLDPEKMSGAGISAAALKTRFLPMLAKCDVLREQYGEAICDMLRDMLAMARKLDTEPRLVDGVPTMTRVKLPPKIEELGDRVNTRERNPGDGEHVTLAWPPYFPASWQDRKEAIAAVKEGTGGQPVMSQETAVETIAPVFGIEDARAELRQIDEDAEGNMDRARRALAGGAPKVPPREEINGRESARDQEGEEAEA